MMRNRFSSPWIRLFCSLFLFFSLSSCSKEGGGRSATLNELETRVKMLEQRIEDQDKFVKQAKEVLGSHRQHILELEKKVEVLTNPRFRPGHLGSNPTR